MKLRYFCILFLLLTALIPKTAQAEEFTRINWSEMKLDSVLPYYTTQIQLGDEYNYNTYRVTVEYPEYQALTKTEVKQLLKLNPDLADSAQVSSTLGVMRKQGTLDIAILPFIIRDKKYFKLISFKLAIYKTPIFRSKQLATATSSSRYVAHSVLASGKWVKIYVTDEGVYQLTKSSLSSMGFSNPDKVKLYGYGGYMQNEAISYTSTVPDYDDLQEEPLYRTSDGRYLFFARGTIKWSGWTFSSSAYTATHTNNPYSRYSYYFLTEGDSPMAFPTDATPTADQYLELDTLNSFPDHIVYENDAYSWYESGQQFFDSYDYAQGNKKSYALNTPGIVNSMPASVTLSFSASNTTSTNASLSANGTNLGTLTVNANSTYGDAMQSVSTFTTSALAATNTFTITTTAGHAARLDYLRVCYLRALSLTGSSLLFNATDGAAIFNVSGATSNTHIWRLGYCGKPTAEISGTLNGSIYSAKVLDASNHFVAVNVSATFPAPTVVGAIANQDLHADSAADMVIIIPESGNLLTQAERLAAAHKEKDGLRTRIVRADQIYNEFSSGTPDATAYKRYLKMLYDRAETDADAPRYLLLFGASAWDNRMVTTSWKNASPKDYLLSYESWNSTDEVNSYTSDDYFGMLDDGEGKLLTSEKMDIGIGRYPITSESDAKILVDKAITYMNNSAVGSWKNLICMMGDDDNYNQHMIDANGVADRIENQEPALTIKKVYWDAYTRVTTSTGNTYPEARSQILKVMKSGALVMNYSGHGAPYQISHEKVLVRKDFEDNVTNNLPLWIVASCEITPFDTQQETIGETAILNKAGGAISFFSATRAVYSTPNFYMNSYLMKYLLGYDSNQQRYRMGDAVRLSKVSLVSPPSGEYARDVSVNKLKYALCGDPALTLAMATGKIVVDKINGQAVSDTNYPLLSGGSASTVSGHIETPSGTTATDFRGNIWLTVFDSKDTIVCKNNVKADISPYTFETRDKVLYQGTDSVKAGHFTIEFPIPLDISYSNQQGLLSLYAVNAAKNLEAKGESDAFRLGSSATPIANDSIGPKIFAYLNTPTFVDGGKVNETPTFVALLQDSDGINASGNGVGHDLELVIDGNEETSYNLNDYYTNDFGYYTIGTARFTIPALSEGKHRLYFRAWDQKNNSSSTALNFVVVKGLAPSVVSLTATPNPASTKTTFILGCDRTDIETQYTLDIYDTFGRKCWTYTSTDVSSNGYFEIPWSLTTANGISLSNGIYLVKATVACEGSSSSSETKKLIIVHNK